MWNWLSFLSCNAKILNQRNLFRPTCVWSGKVVGVSKYHPRYCECSDSVQTIHGVWIFSQAEQFLGICKRGKAHQYFVQCTCQRYRKKNHLQIETCFCSTILKQDSRQKKTTELAPKAKVLRCRPRHTLCQWGGGWHVSTGGGRSVGGGTSEGVAYPWGVGFGPYLVDGHWGGVAFNGGRGKAKVSSTTVCSNTTSCLFQRERSNKPCPFLFVLGGLSSSPGVISTVCELPFCAGSVWFDVEIVEIICGLISVDSIPLDTFLVISVGSVDSIPLGVLLVPFSVGAFSCNSDIFLLDFCFSCFPLFLRKTSYVEPIRTHAPRIPQITLKDKRRLVFFPGYLYTGRLSWMDAHDGDCFPCKNFQRESAGASPRFWSKGSDQIPEV